MAAMYSTGSDDGCVRPILIDGVLGAVETNIRELESVLSIE